MQLYRQQLGTVADKCRFVQYGKEQIAEQTGGPGGPVAQQIRADGRGDLICDYGKMRPVFPVLFILTGVCCCCCYFDYVSACQSYLTDPLSLVGSMNFARLYNS